MVETNNNDSINRYIFGSHRGGSTVLGTISNVCAKNNNINYHGLNNKNSYNSFKPFGKDGCAIKKPDGTIFPNPENWLSRNGLFAPIRHAKMFPYEILKKGDILFFNVRDPRDCITSSYFGMLKLHGSGLNNPKKQNLFDLGIDNYVINERLANYKKAYDDYIFSIKKFGFKVLKYELMVCEYHKWLSKFYEILQFDENRFDECFDKTKTLFDAVEENENNHKRKMVPGDHKEKLKGSTIDILNKELGYILEFFGYEK